MENETYLPSLLEGYAITNVRRLSWQNLSCNVNGHRVQIITDNESSMLTVFVDEDAAQLDLDAAARWIAARIR